MAISVDDVKQLLQHDDPEARLVLIEGRTEIITPREAGSEKYRGALQVISRDDLIKRTGGAEASDHDLAEQAALLDSTISELGG
ncbi:hypothetical protein [Mycobacterium sp. 1274761.0]|uniref:hypothetical protein n=1 Tax=Mycobacterium sp. 1274761.0 TaxID=1834077 RepID=UPI0007FC9B56|nr:hypothetical protein [Mycobacterium sp. 1274761.0]OBK74931.1 hypothetical protein A5651_08570 [Mycobacterium sp. 1274761.0]